MTPTLGGWRLDLNKPDFTHEAVAIFVVDEREALEVASGRRSVVGSQRFAVHSGGQPPRDISSDRRVVTLDDDRGVRRPERLEEVLVIGVGLVLSLIHISEPTRPY